MNDPFVEAPYQGEETRTEAGGGPRRFLGWWMKIGELATGEDKTMNKAQTGRARQFWRYWKDLERQRLLWRDLVFA